VADGTVSTLYGRLFLDKVVYSLDASDKNTEANDEAMRWCDILNALGRLLCGAEPQKVNPSISTQ
jgi:hypothetical protein